jgi:hypothetical protein
VEVGSFFGKVGTTLPSAALIGIFIAVSALLALPVHEAGHLLGGWLAGFRFQLFAVGPLMVMRTADGLHVRWHTDFSLYGGIAASLPTDLRDLTRREGWMVAGGPGTSLLAGAGSLFASAGLAAASVFADASAALALAGTGLSTFGAASVGIGLITLLPTTTSGFLTDGARLWRLWRGHPSADRNAAVFALTSLTFTERPREWPASLVEQAVGTEDGTLYDVEGHRMAYLYALDTGRLTAARGHLQVALDRHGTYPASAESVLFVEAAFFEGGIRADAEAARHWFTYVDEARSAFLNEGSCLRARAAFDAAAGEVGDETLAAAREALAASTTPGLAEAERDWLETLASPSAS